MELTVGSPHDISSSDYLRCYGDCLLANFEVANQCMFGVICVTSML